jgi:hypothetical protein
MTVESVCILALLRGRAVLQGQCGGFVDRAVGHGDGVAQAARSGARAARVGGGAGGNSARQCASVGAGPHDRSPRTPELHRPPRTGIAKKKSATSVGSRSAAPAPAAGSVCWRSSLGRRAPRARETAARVVNARPDGSANSRRNRHDPLDRQDDARNPAGN